MLGIGCPDRHALPCITSSKMRRPRRVLPPARAGSFFDPKRSFRPVRKSSPALPVATGITAYLANSGALDHGQEVAAYESPRTSKLYVPRKSGSPQN
jgi:hypothetical protein